VKLGVKKHGIFNDVIVRLRRKPIFRFGDQDLGGAKSHNVSNQL
jgi:hypothetical protein